MTVTLAPAPDHATPLALADARRLAASGRGRAIRLEAHLSLYDMGRAIGTTATTVHRWERGVCLPRGDLAIRYGALLDALARQLGEPLNESSPGWHPDSDPATERRNGRAQLSSPV